MEDGDGQELRGRVTAIAARRAELARVRRRLALGHDAPGPASRRSGETVHEHAAAVHERAAGVHEAAANLFERHAAEVAESAPRRAERARRSADRERELAAREWGEADAQHRTAAEQA